ncbi:MAG: TIGR01777 family oxidoreductase [Ectobacillus sp.]
MKIAISGGTGFIGKALSVHLANKGHTVYILTRKHNEASKNKNIQYIKWSANDQTFPFEAIDAFINLAGEPINSGRWTKRKKEQIITSRLETTQGILKQISFLAKRPQVFINASAIGYYGASQTDTFTEQHLKHGTDFLATTVVKWEDEARKAEELGIRTVLARFGIVLGKEGGALPKIVFPYKLFIGGTVGSGRQWVSWVHIDDVAKMIAFALETPAISGPLNITAPHPVTMKEFGKLVAKVLGKPHWLPIPSFVLRIVLGEMSTLVLDGQRVLPAKAMHNGYEHSYPNLEKAFTTILTYSERSLPLQSCEGRSPTIRGR